MHALYESDLLILTHGHKPNPYFAQTLTFIFWKVIGQLSQLALHKIDECLKIVEASSSITDKVEFDSKGEQEQFEPRICYDSANLKR